MSGREHLLSGPRASPSVMKQMMEVHGDGTRADGRRYSVDAHLSQIVARELAEPR